MKNWKIGIVGGGPGGLMTAYALEKLVSAPFRTTLFEASLRLGGKILTRQFDSHSISYEAGAAEFYDYSRHDEDDLKQLIQELGLPILKMGGPAVVMDDRILDNVDDFHEKFGAKATQELLAFDQLAKDQMTPNEFFHANDHSSGVAINAPNRFDSLLATVSQPEARQYIETLMHSDLATEPHQTSIAYGLQNYLMNDLRYMDLYGIVGGNERLPQKLARRIAATIRLEHRVESIAKTDQGQYRVSSVHDGKTQEDDFDFVVIALPLNHFLSVGYPCEKLAKAIRDHHDFYDYPAHYLRMTLLFEHPFWHHKFTDSYLMLDQFGGCCLYDESSSDPGNSQGVLGWLLGGDDAQRMSEWSDDDLISAALDSLPDFLQHGRHAFLEGRIHRWIGAVNAMPGGNVPVNLDQRHQPEPLEHENLHCVGDYLFDSTLNGVLDSANYVAEWIAAKIADGN